MVRVDGATLTMNEETGVGIETYSAPRSRLIDREREIADRLGKREDIKLFLKLPRWFKVTTPVGTYNPDWAVVKQADDGEPIVYLVRESKGTDVITELTSDDRDKVLAGMKHFSCLGVDYKVIKSANQI